MAEASTSPETTHETTTMAETFTSPSETTLATTTTAETFTSPSETTLPTTTTAEASTSPAETTLATTTMAETFTSSPETTLATTATAEASTSPSEKTTLESTATAEASTSPSETTLATTTTAETFTSSPETTLATTTTAEASTSPSETTLATTTTAEASTSPSETTHETTTMAEASTSAETTHETTTMAETFTSPSETTLATTTTAETFTSSPETTLATTTTAEASTSPSETTLATTTTAEASTSPSKTTLETTTFETTTFEATTMAEASMAPSVSVTTTASISSVAKEATSSVSPTTTPSVMNTLAITSSATERAALTTPLVPEGGATKSTTAILTTVSLSTTPFATTAVNESVIQPVTKRPEEQPPEAGNTTTPLSTTLPVATTSSSARPPLPPVIPPVTPRMTTKTTPVATIPVTVSASTISTQATAGLPTPTATQVFLPNVEQFTVNFTTTNLKYNPSSEEFNMTVKDLISRLDQLLRNSSIGPDFMGCRVTGVRAENNGDATGIDCVCTYRNISTVPAFDRVRVYHEMVNMTNGFTKMGPHDLERYSLYVNGYNEAPLETTVLPTTTQTPTPTPASVINHFTVNFTVTNLKYKDEMGIPNSKTFNSTERVLIAMLGRILINSSIGPAYLGCEVTTLRPVRNGEETGMDAICTYRNDSATPVFDRVKVYHEIVNQTNAFTKMGPYRLERYSLYVNGYHEAPLEPTVLPTTTQTPTPAPATEHFTVNYTITNLKYKEEMGIPNSKVFNSTEESLTNLLDRILINSSVGPVFLECRVVTLKPVRNGAETSVDTVCTYRNDSTTPIFDRVKVYDEIVNMTNGFTKMGPYDLERYSLYVNGYHKSPVEPPVLPTTTQTPTPAPAIEDFTVNFTVTNLKYRNEMGIPNSKTFNSTQRALITMLGRILVNSSIGPAYLGCEVTTLRPVRNGEETGMDAICTYRNDSATPVFDRVKVYHEIVNQTNAFTKMGPYRLERYSLYVNGYHEAPLEPTVLPTTTQTPTPAPATEHFTVNYTITNLKYKEEMGIPNSKVFNSTEESLTNLLDRILINSSVGPVFLECRVVTLKPVRNGAETSVDTVCTYRNDSTTPIFDRVKVYDEIVNMTNGFTKMGPYDLERYSLYVNGYHKSPVEPPVLPTTTQTPTPAPAIEDFTVNFTVTNLKYRNEMGIPNSKTFNSTQRALITMLGRILVNSSIGPAYLGCEVTTLRPVRNGEETGMDAICTYRNDSATPVFDRVNVYHEIVNQTNAFTKMGPYRLERYSLYVNGYHEAPVEPPPVPTKIPTPTPVVEHFTVNYTVTNLKYKDEMGTPDSKTFNSTERALLALLGRILVNSSIGPAYLGCEVTSLRPVKNGEETGMDAVCAYRSSSNTPAFDRVKVYHEIVNQTNAFTRMGPYHLERYSLYVNGYHEVPLEPTVLPTTILTPTPAVEQFTVNFTITNLKYKEEMGIPNSKTFNSTERTLTTLLGRILTGSSIGQQYLGCEVTSLRPVRNGDETGMDAICTYRNNSTIPLFDRVKVYHEIVNRTNAFTKMGPYRLERYSLCVNGYNEAPVEATVLPTTAPKVEHFSVNFTVTNLRYKEEMATPNTKTFNSTERALTTLLGRILSSSSSSIGPAYLGCKVAGLRPVKNWDETGMDAICTYRKNATMSAFDRVKVYREIVNRTNGFTKMGPYNLEQYSLYVNGYHEEPLEATVLPTTAPKVEHFSVNFTVTNLRYKEEMATPNTKTFNSTERALTTLLGRILRSSIGPAYLGCKVAGLRPVKNWDETGMDAICTYRKNATMSAFDRVKVYHEIVNRTNGFTKMGPYNLEQYSLYVNDYHEAYTPPTTALPPTTQAPGFEHFVVNYTVTNLKYKPDMGVPNSKVFNSTERALTSLLGQILVKSSIGPEFMGCQAITFRPANSWENTEMDAICSYRTKTSVVPFDRVRVYHELVNKTSDFTKMGPYTLARNSLYVNGYHKVISVPPHLPTTAPPPAMEQFTINFTATNLKYKPEMGIPKSKLFNSTERTFTSLMGQMFPKSTIGPMFTGCNLTALRSVDANTGIDSICHYRRNSTAPPFDREKVYHEFVNMTKGFTRMGPYSLERDSLYVNGYHEPSVTPSFTTVATTHKTPMVGHFTVNYTLTNLRFTKDLETPGSRRFNSTGKVMNHFMDPLLRKTSVSPALIGCKVEGFRAVEFSAGVTVNTLCSYQKDLLPAPFDREKVYGEFSDLTEGGTKIGQYKVEKYSLHVHALPGFGPES
ncbi:mucin-16-like isoform X2 [Hemicordylus capensis]|uniref:mucin-16-like isoform X2 n=1 Tax=Hemicordylus capensis TaxID=884348 RepID=UPI002303199F|nr:mucin-16-like isoform X2 [Hemicordylus capensis]